MDSSHEGNYCRHGWKLGPLATAHPVRKVYEYLATKGERRSVLGVRSMQMKSVAFGFGAQTSDVSLEDSQTISTGEAKLISLEARPHGEGGADAGHSLSQREQDVLYWLAQGKSGQETSMILGIALCTVRVHIRNLLKKLDASNIPHAVTLAYQKGILNF